MHLRKATHADIPAIVELFLRLKRKGPYAAIPHDLDRARKMMRFCISNMHGYLSVVEQDGEIQAALIGQTQEFWWSARRYATDLAFVSEVSRGGELLARDFCAWAWARTNVDEVLIGQSSSRNIEATHNFFMSLGFEHAGGIYRLNRFDADELNQGVAA